MNPIIYDTLCVATLRQICKNSNITGTSKMNKTDLLSKIQQTNLVITSLPELVTESKAKKEPKPKKEPKKEPKKPLEDGYTVELLRMRANLYKHKYIETAKMIKETGMPIRQENTPEDITENMAKFIIKRQDPTIKWAKSIGVKGDLCSEIQTLPEVKSFISNGPSSFGPKKVFGVIYFLDLRRWIEEDNIVLWKVNLTNESPEWKGLKMNKLQTNEEQCGEKRRPHISWDKIYEQIGVHCEQIYSGTFEDILA